jgi:plastocyanin
MRLGAIGPALHLGGAGVNLNSDTSQRSQVASDFPQSPRSLTRGALASAAAMFVLAVAPLRATRVVASGPASTRGPAVARATGRIEGTVEISTALTVRRPQIRIYADPGSGSLPPAPPRDAIAAETRNVVIYLEGDSLALAGSAELVAQRRHGIIAQHDERFAPHVLAVMQGATVEFPNEDDVFHNVFSLSSAAGGGGFDLGRYPKGSSRSRDFPRAGTVQVFCHIHQDMSAILLVLANPFFATPDENHRYVIDDVPAGDYTIVAWHERIRPPITRRIHVTAGVTSFQDFNIPLPQGGAK